MFNIVNDKQTTDELKMSIFSSRRNRFVNVLIAALIVQYMHEIYINFYISHRAFLGLSASNIHAQRKCLSFKLFKRYIDFFIHMRTDHDGGTNAKHTVGREVME